MSLCHKSCHCPPITPFIQIPKSVAASHCTTLQHPIHLHTYQSRCVFSALQRGAACCSVVRRVAAWCSVVQCGAVWCSVLQHVTDCCSVYGNLWKKPFSEAFLRSLSATSSASMSCVNACVAAYLNAACHCMSSVNACYLNAAYRIRLHIGCVCLGVHIGCIDTRHAGTCCFAL